MLNEEYLRLMIKAIEPEDYVKPTDDEKVELSDEDLDNVSGGVSDNPELSHWFSIQGDLLPNRPVFHPDEKG